MVYLFYCEENYFGSPAFREYRSQEKISFKNHFHSRHPEEDTDQTRSEITYFRSSHRHRAERTLWPITACCVLITFLRQTSIMLDISSLPIAFSGLFLKHYNFTDRRVFSMVDMAIMIADGVRSRPIQRRRPEPSVQCPRGLVRYLHIYIV